MSDTHSPAQVRAALAAVVAAWRPDRPDAGAQQVDTGPLADFQGSLWDTLAADPLRGAWEANLAAVALIAEIRTATYTTFPSAKVPGFLAAYLRAVTDAGDAAALEALLTGAHTAARAFYIDGGIFKLMKPDDTVMTIVGDAKDGKAVSNAFDVSALAAGVGGGDEAWSAAVQAALRKDAALCDRLAELQKGLRYLAGGFSVAGWGTNISQYFDDAGAGLYEALNASAQFIETCRPTPSAPAPP